MGRINKVTTHCAGLVLRWVTNKTDHYHLWCPRI